MVALNFVFSGGGGGGGGFRAVDKDSVARWCKLGCTDDTGLDWVTVTARLIFGLPMGPQAVPFYGLYLEPYKVIPKRNYFGAYG